MLNKKNSYAKELSKRILIIIILIFIAFLSHRLFASYEKEVIGAIAFITIFTAGLLFYYIKLFKANKIHKIEFIISLLLVFVLTVIMFAIIYAEPIEKGKNYFIEDNIPTALSFPDALYFSATTITTLGYGDIVPVGVFRYFVVAEVFLGLVYTGVMIYFITTAMGRE